MVATVAILIVLAVVSLIYICRNWDPYPTRP